MKTSNKLEVLVIEDDRAYNNALVNYLQEHFGRRVNVKGFQAGEQCLGLIDKKTEVVILDYLLNSRIADAMNGISVLNLIKKKNPNTEVIMISGRDKIDLAVKAMHLGAFNYIVKGKSTFQQISKSVRSIIHNYTIREKLKHYRLLSIATIAGIIFIIGVAIAMQVFAPGILK